MSCRDAVAEHLPARILDPVRGFDRAERLHTPQALQKLGRLDVNDRVPSNPGKHVLLQTDARALGMAGAYLHLMHGHQPFAADVLEGARARQASRGKPRRFCPRQRSLLLGLALVARVNTRCRQLACFVSALARVGQRDLGVHAEGQPLLGAAEAIFHAPVARAVGVQFKVQPAAIGQLHGLVGVLRLANFEVGQLVREHGGISGRLPIRLGAQQAALCRPMRKKKGAKWLIHLEVIRK